VSTRSWLPSVSIRSVKVVAATFGAALETLLSCGYTVSQYFGWQWGKFVKPAESSRFHLVMIIVLLIGGATLLTTVDPIKVTEYSVVFSAVALPLTYLPILIIANDPDYVAGKTNGRLMNVVSGVFLVIIVMASLAAIPLMIWTKAEQ
jgi:manganese transport protein